MEGCADLVGWLHTEMMYLYLQKVTHPSINPAQRRVTFLSQSNALPLSQTANYRLPVLDHTRIIKYHTLKYVRIVNNIKYASAGRTRSIRKAFTTRHQYTRRERGTSKVQTKSATVNRRRKIAVIRQEFEEKSVSSKLIVRTYSI